LGIDGYYYIGQISSLLNNGSIRFSTPTPAVLYYLTSLSFLLGNTILAIKVGAIALNLLAAFAVFFIVKKIAEDSLLGIFAVSIWAVSSLHLYLIVEFVSYLGAIASLLWALYFGICFVKKQRTLFLVVASACLILAIGSHRSVIPISLLFTLFLAGAVYYDKAKEPGNRNLFFSCLLFFITLFLFPALIAIQPFFSIPREWAFEISYLPSFPAKLTTFPELLILFLSSVIFLFFSSWKNDETNNKTAIIFFRTVALWSLLVTLNPFVSPEFGFATVGGRLRLLAYIQVALMVPAVIWLLRNRYSKIHWYVVAIVFPLMIWSFLNPLPLGAQPDYLARRERLIEGLKTNLPPIDNSSMIVATHGEQFVVTAITGIPSQQIYPKETRYASVYWLLNLVPSTFLDPSMKTIARDKVGSYTVLVKDGPAFRQRLQSPEFKQLLRSANKPLDLYLADHGDPSVINFTPR